MARILVVDDEESIRRALEKRLRKLGHDVAIAPDGVEALEAFRRTPFDLVISDFRMPRMDGLDLMRKLREWAPTLPVIMITGTSTDTPEMFLDQGAQAYLLKPVSKEDLEATLNRVLAGTAGGEPGSSTGRHSIA
jgi:CheY-like chemotaxis protein